MDGGPTGDGDDDGHISGGKAQGAHLLARSCDAFMRMSQKCVMIIYDYSIITF